MRLQQARAVAMNLITPEDLDQAAKRIRTTCWQTPVLPVEHPDQAAPLWIKAESLQHTGSFKLRGATNAVAAVQARSRTAGFVTYSSGNHGKALASAARKAGATATVVMPETAPEMKVDATRASGATVVILPPDEIVAHAHHLANTEQLTLVPPYDDPWVIAGQGTVGLEILDQIESIDTVLVPVGGGGLIAGVASAVKYRRPATRVIGVEPALAGDLAAGYATGSRTEWSRALTGRTIADGLRSASVGELPWAHITALVDDVLTVSENSIVAAMRWIAQSARIVVEPSGAVGMAAVLEYPSLLGSATTVAVATGGNVDSKVFASLVGARANGE